MQTDIVLELFQGIASLARLTEATIRRLTMAQLLEPYIDGLETSIAKAFLKQGTLFLEEMAERVAPWWPEPVTEALREAYVPAGSIDIGVTQAWQEAVGSSFALFEEPMHDSAMELLRQGSDYEALELEYKGDFALGFDEGLLSYADQTVAGRVTEINKTTRDYINTQVTTGIKEGWSYNQIAGAITDRFEEFAVGRPQEHIQSRAHLVAVTETADVFLEGRMRTAQTIADMGFEVEKFWATVGDDRVSEECLANEAAGWVPLDHQYITGLRPPGHPGCRCDEHTRRKKEAGEVETEVAGAPKAKEPEIVGVDPQAQARLEELNGRFGEYSKEGARDRINELETQKGSRIRKALKEHVGDSPTKIDADLMGNVMGQSEKWIEETRGLIRELEDVTEWALRNEFPGQSTIRLYHGSSETDFRWMKDATSGMSWTDNPKVADYFGSSVIAMDMPIEQVRFSYRFTDTLRAGRYGWESEYAIKGGDISGFQHTLYTNNNVMAAVEAGTEIFLPGVVEESMESWLLGGKKWNMVAMEEETGIRFDPREMLPPMTAGQSSYVEETIGKWKPPPSRFDKEVTKLNKWKGVDIEFAGETFEVRSSTNLYAAYEKDQELFSNLRVSVESWVDKELQEVGLRAFDDLFPTLNPASIEEINHGMLLLRQDQCVGMASLTRMKEMAIEDYAMGISHMSVASTNYMPVMLEGLSKFNTSTGLYYFYLEDRNVPVEINAWFDAQPEGRMGFDVKGRMESLYGEQWRKLQGRGPGTVAEEYYFPKDEWAKRSRETTLPSLAIPEMVAGAPLGISVEEASEEWFDFESHSAIAAASRGESLVEWEIQGIPLSPDRQARYEEMAKVLQERASQDNTGLNILHRGEAHEFVDSFRAKYPTGKTITLEGLTATTSDLEVARVYTDPQFLGLEPNEGVRAFVHFENPKGITGFNRDNVEYLLPNGGAYRVTRSWADNVGNQHVTLYATR